jgi:uncharacterized protein YdcH (DUF465 family)
MNSSSAGTEPSNEAGFRNALEINLGRVDQSITGHSFLRDKFSRRAATLSSIILVGAAIVTFLAVSSESIRTYFFLSNSRADYLIGLLGFIVLLCSIFELKISWRERSSRHAEAANALARLKLLITRELASDLALTKARFAEIQQAYENVNDLIAKIPEGRFLELKALHRRKVEMSKFLDKHPGASIHLLRFKIWLRDSIRTWLDEK